MCPLVSFEILLYGIIVKATNNNAAESFILELKYYCCTIHTIEFTKLYLNYITSDHNCDCISYIIFEVCKFIFFCNTFQFSGVFELSYKLDICIGTTKDVFENLMLNLDSVFVYLIKKTYSGGAQ